MEARNQLELARILRSDGFYVLQAESSDDKKSGLIKEIINFDISRVKEKFFGISLEEKMFFSKNLAVMLSSGISLTRALDVLIKQTHSHLLKETLRAIQNDIRSGKRFSDSIGSFPHIFKPLYSSMVKVGETAGNLDESLGILAEQLEKEHELKSRIRGALIYPIVILVAMAGIGVLMLITVIPNLKSVFEDLELELPMTTRAILYLSDALILYWWAFIAGTIFTMVGFKQFFGTKKGRKILAWTLLHVPVFRPLVLKINNAIFARTLSSLLDGGVTILEALEITSTTVSNVYFQESILSFHTVVKKGGKLHSALERYPSLYTPLIIEMIEVGQETGKLPDLLSGAAEFYEGEVSDITRNLSALIEPILMLFIGAIIGFFAVSIMQPIYGMLGSV